MRGAKKNPNEGATLNATAEPHRFSGVSVQRLALSLVSASVLGVAGVTVVGAMLVTVLAWTARAHRITRGFGRQGGAHLPRGSAPVGCPVD